ncbi:hypothetical protein PO909_024201 [Leuciscus waleckii]
MATTSIKSLPSWEASMLSAGMRQRPVKFKVTSAQKWPFTKDWHLSRTSVCPRPTAWSPLVVVGCMPEVFSTDGWHLMKLSKWDYSGSSVPTPLEVLDPLHTEVGCPRCHYDARVLLTLKVVPCLADFKDGVWCTGCPRWHMMLLVF